MAIFGRLKAKRFFMGAGGGNVAEVTATAAELNALDGITSTVAELNILDGVTATTAEINGVLDASANEADLTPGTGLSTATGFVHNSTIIRQGAFAVTRIFMDLTGLNSGGVAGDIIGKDGGTANCHFGQVTAATTGVIYAGRVMCIEAPAGGDPDINFDSGDEATGAENAAVSGLTNHTALVNTGDLAIGSNVTFTLNPLDDQYLYMSVGTSTDADYTAGKIIVELWGVVTQT